MTIDERLQFLVQSTESLHATTQELHASMRELRDSVESMRSTVEEHTKQLEIDAENIRRLANIAAAHEQRLSNLEDGEAQNGQE